VNEIFKDSQCVVVRNGCESNEEKTNAAKNGSKNSKSSHQDQDQDNQGELDDPVTQIEDSTRTARDTSIIDNDDNDNSMVGSLSVVEALSVTLAADPVDDQDTDEDEEENPNLSKVKVDDKKKSQETKKKSNDSFSHPLNPQPPASTSSSSGQSKEGTKNPVGTGLPKLPPKPGRPGNRNSVTSGADQKSPVNRPEWKEDQGTGRSKQSTSSFKDRESSTNMSTTITSSNDMTQPLLSDRSGKGDNSCWCCTIL